MSDTPVAQNGQKTRKLCRHCGIKPVNRPRGTCWGCYYTPGIRDLYPSTSKFARRGVGSKYTGEPDTPTVVEPGSENKIAEMERRAAEGKSLFHPDDPNVLPDYGLEATEFYGVFRARMGRDRFHAPPRGRQESWLENINLRGE